MAQPRTDESAQVPITTDAATAFLTWLESASDDEGLLGTLMGHPGYRTVAAHSAVFGDSPVTREDFLLARSGKPSRLYGMSRVRENIPAIRRAITYVEERRSGIRDLVDASLRRVFSVDEIYPLEIHCVVGYDMGVGLQGSVAINLNTPLYLNDPCEIGYMLVHEATHVAYERVHGPSSVHGLERPGAFRRLVLMLLQNEGLAVYTPLRARIAANCLDNPDYRFLLDPDTLSQKTEALRDLITGLGDDYPGDKADAILSRLSRERLSYVVGCAAFVKLEEEGGDALVREAARWTPERFAALIAP